MMGTAVARAALIGTLLLAGCASTPPPSATLADAVALAMHARPGVATRSSVQAALGPTRRQAFDSGYEVWQYQLARPGGRYAEYIILFGPDGVVRKTRQREPSSLDGPMN